MGFSCWPGKAPWKLFLSFSLCSNVFQMNSEANCKVSWLCQESAFHFQIFCLRGCRWAVALLITCKSCHDKEDVEKIQEIHFALRIFNCCFHVTYVVLRTHIYRFILIIAYNRYLCKYCSPRYQQCRNCY